MAFNDWVARAADVPQKTTLTPANTWASGDTIVLGSHNSQLTITVGSDSDLEDIAAMIVRAVNNVAVTNESRTSDGSMIPGWTGNGGSGVNNRCVAEYDTTTFVVTITGRPGHPFSFTETEVTAGSGTLTLATLQAADGKHFRNNVLNWSLGSLPDADDTTRFRDNDVDMLYGLDDASPSVLLADEFEFWPSYTGNIGLPDVVAWNQAMPYRTSFTKHMTVIAVGAETYNFMKGDGAGSQRIRIDTSTPATSAAITSNFKGTRLDNDVPVVEIINLDTVCSIGGSAGDVRLTYSGASVADNTVDIRTRGGVEDDFWIEFENATSVDTAGPSTINKHGGRAIFRGSANHTTLNNQAGTTHFLGSEGFEAATISGGTVYDSGTGPVNGIVTVRGTGRVTVDEASGVPASKAIGGSGQFNLYGTETRIDDNFGMYATLDVNLNHGARASQVGHQDNIAITFSSIT